MFAPLAAIRPAIAAITAGVSGLPSTVTCSRPRCRDCSPEPRVISMFMPRSSASAETWRWMAVRSGESGQPSRTPSTRWPRITTCSTSSTVRSWADSPEKSRDVTPGRSRPVSVTSRVVCGRDMALTTLPSRPGSGAYRGLFRPAAVDRPGGRRPARPQSIGSAAVDGPAAADRPGRHHRANPDCDMRSLRDGYRDPSPVWGSIRGFILPGGRNQLAPAQLDPKESALVSIKYQLRETCLTKVPSDVADCLVGIAGQAMP